MPPSDAPDQIHKNVTKKKAADERVVEPTCQPSKSWRSHVPRGGSSSEISSSPPASRTPDSTNASSQAWHTAMSVCTLIASAGMGCSHLGQRTFTKKV